MAHEVQAQEIETGYLHSSWLTHATYDPRSQTCNVYTTAGRAYTLTGVPPDVWSEFKDADSHGQFFNDRLKGKY